MNRRISFWVEPWKGLKGFFTWRPPHDFRTKKTSVRISLGLTHNRLIRNNAENIQTAPVPMGSYGILWDPMGFGQKQSQFQVCQSVFVSLQVCQWEKCLRISDEVKKISAGLWNIPQSTKSKYERISFRWIRVWGMFQGVLEFSWNYVYYWSISTEIYGEYSRLYGRYQPLPNNLLYKCLGLSKCWAFLQTTLMYFLHSCWTHSEKNNNMTTCFVTWCVCKNTH